MTCTLFDMPAGGVPTSPVRPLQPEKLELREYQEQAVEAAGACKRGVILAPTGSGKSLMIAAQVERSGMKAVVLQPSKEILESNFDKIQRTGFKDARIFSASMGIKQVGRCTFATIGSIISKTHHFEDTELLIVDECHTVNAKGGQYADLIRALKNLKLITGYSASPFRRHTTSLGTDIRMLTRTHPRAFDQMAHVIQTQDLIRDGFLVMPEFIVAKRRQDHGLKLNKAGSDYTDRSIRAYLKKIKIEGVIAIAAQQALARGSKRQLAFLPTLYEAERTVAALKAAKVEAAMVDGEMPMREREARLRDFRAGSITAMANVGVLTTGYDFPALDCVILGRPTKSLGLYYQMVGRCVRPAPGKQQAWVYDLVDNFATFGNPLDMRIVEESPGLHAVLSAKGRLTGRLLEREPEAECEIGFGPYARWPLWQVPTDWLRYVIDSPGGHSRDSWQTCNVELQRRQFWGGL